MHKELRRELTDLEFVHILAAQAWKTIPAPLKSCLEFADLVAYGWIGMAKAKMIYRPGRASLHSFAFLYVRGGIANGLRLLGIRQRNKSGYRYAPLEEEPLAPEHDLETWIDDKKRAQLIGPICRRVLMEGMSQPQAAGCQPWTASHRTHKEIDYAQAG